MRTWLYDQKLDRLQANIRIDSFIQSRGGRGLIDCHLENHFKQPLGSGIPRVDTAAVSSIGIVSSVLVLDEICSMIKQNESSDSDRDCKKTKTSSFRRLG